MRPGFKDLPIKGEEERQNTFDNAHLAVRRLIDAFLKIMPKQKKKTIKHTVLVPVTDPDEAALFKRCGRGDTRARDILLERYNPWAVNLARKYHAYFPHVELGELVAEGSRGVLEALKRFDPSRKTKFSTYAWFWILKNIQEYITTSAGLIEVPRSVLSDLKKIVSAMDTDIKNGNEPSMDSLSRKLKLDTVTIREILADRKNVSHPVSLDKFLDENDHGDTLSDMVEDKRQVSMQEIIDQTGDAASMAAVLGRLAPQERDIIRLRFGFRDNHFYTLKEAGARLKLSSAKVKDIESIALFKLKKLMAERENED